MLYVYDEAICNDLEKSFNTDETNEPVVKVCSPTQVISVIAQIKEGQNLFPIVAITRSDNIEVDTDRTNFTRQHRGVASVIDIKTNDLFYEKAMPIKLSYTLTVLTTNTADMDEITRELLFKYSNMFYLTIKLPYEADRKIRFGVVIDSGSAITRESYTSDYYESGQIYQTSLTLNCQGCVLVHYTPNKLQRFEVDDVGVDIADYSDMDLGFSYTKYSGIDRSHGFATGRRAIDTKNRKLSATAHGVGKRMQRLSVSRLDISKSQPFSATVYGDNNKSQPFSATVVSDNNKSQGIAVSKTNTSKSQPFSASRSDTSKSQPFSASRTDTSKSQPVSVSNSNTSKSQPFSASRTDTSKSQPFTSTIYSNNNKSQGLQSIIKSDNNKSKSLSNTVMGKGKGYTGTFISKTNKTKSSNISVTVNNDIIK